MTDTSQVPAAQAAPQGWRDIANGRFEVEPKALPSYELEAAPTTPEAPALGAAPSQAPAAAEPAAGRGRTWPALLLVALLAGAAGFGAGAVLDPTGRGAEQDERATELRDESVALSTREGDLAEGEAALAKARRKLAERRRAVAGREDAVAERERAVAQAEQALAEQPAVADALTEDGVFEVGVEVAAGTYEASDPTDACTWGETASADEEVPADEARTASAGVTAMATLTADRFFHTAGCGTWELTD